MRYELFSSSVVGYKNILNNSKSQDFIDYKRYKNAVICAVADGHSTSFFKYSGIGAEFACKACIEILEKYVDETEANVKVALDERIIQKQIYSRWMDLVNKDYTKNNPIVFRTQYIKYSTTLVATLINENFILYLKIGDGDIVIKSENKYQRVIKTVNKNVVDSLGRFNAYDHMNYKLYSAEEYKNSNIILFTDGYENSFNNDRDLFDSLDKTMYKYNKNIFSRGLLNKDYKKYLNNLSKNCSLDDISIIFIILK